MIKSKILELQTKPNDLEIKELLESIGLTKNQALVYLELVKRNSADATVLCEATGIKNSKIYTILNKLESLGLLIVESNTKPKSYRVLMLEESLDNFTEAIKSEYNTKLKNLDELKVRLMPLFDSLSTSAEFAFILKGEKIILNHISSKITLAKKSVVLVSPCKDYYDKFKNTLNELINDNISVKIGINHLTTQELKKFVTSNDILPMNCNLFYVIVDGSYLILISRWEDPNSMYAIVTSDSNLIKINSDYLETPACLIPR